VKVTEEHPFYTSTGWLSAKELKPDSKIKTINGFINISSIKRLESKTEVFNFEVENFHTYLVGNSGAVVHNDCRVRLKDGTEKVLTFDETNKLIGEGKVDQILDANVGYGTTKKSIGEAWKEHKEHGGTAFSFKYDGDLTDNKFMSFIQSQEGKQYTFEYGQTAQEINSNLLGWSLGQGIGIVHKTVNQKLSLLKELKPTLDRINQGIKFPHKNDGSVFKNKQSLLPVKPAGYYREYVHPTEGLNHAGLQRVVIGKNGETYFTKDHYGSFTRIK